ncbi:DUF389 domain-containing protein [Actinoplanes sp. NBC_00393]|uniref:DUF389 domain-containing protein n=1 Tax=Actinoplanes sp. NBC_00393 TaxID=2975953 RepID=UPI002E1F1960
MTLIRTRVTDADLDRMVGRLFLDTRRQRTAFWVLLVLAAVIATAGVVADSDATVIGAMIVAPLMTPILGTGFGLVLAERRHIVGSVLLVVAGAVVVIVIGYVLGLLVPGPIVADTNSQVASRVHPELIDLVAALATGAVGAFALVRSDVSDTLPGVAIAISLVPPLAVVGLTLESGAPGQSAGALLLFATNVAAIVATATAVLIGYRVRAAAEAVGRPVGRLRPLTLAVIGLVVVLVAIPLTISSAQVIRDQSIVSTAQPVAERWAQSQSWSVVDVTMQQGVLQVAAVGPPPSADPSTLRQALNDAGLADVPARVSLVVGGFRDLPA